LKGATQKKNGGGKNPSPMGNFIGEIKRGNYNGVPGTPKGERWKLFEKNQMVPLVLIGVFG